MAPVFLFIVSVGLCNADSLIIIFYISQLQRLTDWYDGWYARKYGFKTRWGQFLDPLADKILTSAALWAFLLNR